MSSKQFLSSNPQFHGRQFQKFELPHHCHSATQITNNDRSSRAEQSLNNYDKLQKIIMLKIAEVQRQNQKLISISNQLNKTSLSFNLNEQLNSLVYPIQEQMKSAFNQLIHSIQQFYIDIDSKIKEIGTYLTTISGVQTHETSKKDHDDLIFFSNHYQIPKQKPFELTQQQQTIRSINMKIQVMQKDLQQTKSNEAKLMAIIEKLVQKYQINNQTTFVKEDAFLKNKVQGIHSFKAEGNLTNRTQQNQQNLNEYFQSKDRYGEAHNFSKTNILQGTNSFRGQINPLNQIKSKEKPQRNVSNAQTNNDYSIYQQLNKIQQNSHQDYHQRSFGLNNNFSQPKDHFIKNKPKQNLIPQKMQSSMLSVNSYTYSNSVIESDNDPCFIKKLYSKQSPSLTKVSLKNCSNPNKTVFQLNRPLEQTPVDPSNKNHRQAYLLNHLKKTS